MNKRTLLSNETFSQTQIPRPLMPHESSHATRKLDRSYLCRRSIRFLRLAHCRTRTRRHRLFSAGSQTPCILPHQYKRALVDQQRTRRVPPDRDSAGALRRARRNADRRTSGATHASRVCFAQLPHCQEWQPAKSGLGAVLPRVVLIAGRPTLQTQRRSPGVYRNLEPSIARASFLVP